MELWLNKLFYKFGQLPKRLLFQMRNLLHFHLPLAAKSSLFHICEAYFAKLWLSDQFLFPFWDTDKVEIKMHFVFSEVVVPKCHLERAKLSDFKQNFLEQNNLKWCCKFATLGAKGLIGKLVYQIKSFIILVVSRRTT